MVVRVVVLVVVVVTVVEVVVTVEVVVVEVDSDRQVEMDHSGGHQKKWESSPPTICDCVLNTGTSPVYQGIGHVWMGGIAIFSGIPIPDPKCQIRRDTAESSAPQSSTHCRLTRSFKTKAFGQTSNNIQGGLGFRARATSTWYSRGLPNTMSSPLILGQSHFFMGSLRVQE